MKHVKINKLSDINNIVKGLDKSHCLILRDDSSFCGCIYYKDEQWIYMFHCFHIYPLLNNDQCYRWLKQFKEFDLIEVDSLEDMCYEVRQVILDGSIMNIVNPEFELNGKKLTHHLSEIIRDTKPHIGKKVKMKHGDTNKTYLLVGVSETLEDIYYNLIDFNGKLSFMSCCCGYDVVEDETWNLTQEEIIKIRLKHFGDPLSTDVELIH